MANIAVSEDEFSALHEAAHLAKKSGNMELARKLDKMARKTNAALATASLNRQIPRLGRLNVHKMTWKDAPSVFDTDKP